MVYLDNTFIYGETAENHEGYLIDILWSLYDYQLFAKYKKCKFGKTEVEGCFGYWIGNGKVTIYLTKLVNAVQQWQKPLRWRCVDCLYDL